MFPASRFHPTNTFSLHWGLTIVWFWCYSSAAKKPELLSVDGVSEMFVFQKSSPSFLLGIEHQLPKERARRKQKQQECYLWCATWSTRLTFTSNRLCYYILYSPSPSYSFLMAWEVLSERELASCFRVPFRVPHTRDLYWDLLTGRACLQVIIPLRIHGPVSIFLVNRKVELSRRSSFRRSLYARAHSCLSMSVLKICLLSCF